MFLAPTAPHACTDNELHSYSAGTQHMCSYCISPLLRKPSGHLWSPPLLGCYRIRRCHADSNVLSTAGLNDTLERVHWKDLTVEEFEERYERPKKPVIITGLCDGWHAGEAWTEERLLQHYGEHKFKVQMLSHETFTRFSHE